VSYSEKTVLNWIKPLKTQNQNEPFYLHHERFPQKLDHYRDIALPLEVKYQIFSVVEGSVLVCLQVLKRLLPLQACASAPLSPIQPCVLASYCEPLINLKDNPDFSSIRICDKPTFRVDDSPILNDVSANAQSLQTQCDECWSWIDRYYTDVPLLQSRLKSLKDQVNSLTNENNRLQSITQAKEKRQKTTGSVIFKNVEETTTIVNSKIAWYVLIPWFKEPMISKEIWGTVGISQPYHLCVFSK